MPNPAIVLELLKNSGLFDQIVSLSGACLNNAFESASQEAQDSGKIFSPENWIKQKGSLKNIREAVRYQISSLKIFNNMNMLQYF